MPRAYDRTTYDGRTVDWLTRAALEDTAKRLGYDLTITQGSYNAGGVKASAGTHDGGGVVDLAPWDHENKVRELRRTGFAAWFRPAIPGVWPDHIHAVLIGNEKLSVSAKAQVADYLNGRDGLARHGVDNGPRDFVKNRFKWRGPRSFSLAVCNAMSGSNASAARGASILRKTLEAYPKAVIVGVVEASNLLDANATWKPTRDTRDLCKIQGGPVDKAGVALVYDAKRVEVLSTTYRLGALPFIRGKRVGMRNRWILRAKVKVDGRRARWVNVLHLPPPRFAALWPLMVAKVAHLGADLGDFNQTPKAVAAATGKRAVMSGVLGVLVPAWWRSGKARSVDVGGDHDAVAVTIHHRNRKQSAT